MVPRREQEPQRERLVADGDAPRGRAMPGGQFEHARRQLPRGQPPEMPLDGRAQVAGRIGHASRVSVPKRTSPLSPFVPVSSRTLSPRKDFVPASQVLGRGADVGLAQKLPLQPGNLAGGKAPTFRRRSAARNSHAGRAVGSQPQDIAPRPAVADEPEPHRPRAHLEPVILRCRGRFGPKKPFELHPLI